MKPIPLPNATELKAFFEEAEHHVAKIQRAASDDEKNELSRFFSDAGFRLKAATDSQREIDRRLATSFNVFDLIEPDENKLSDILADLLDPAGKHGQRDLFLRLLFEKFGKNPARNLADITTVQREAPTDTIVNYRRRIDVLVDAGEILAIENKVDSAELADQAKDYLQDLNERARQKNSTAVLIYLSPDGLPPSSVQNCVLGATPSLAQLHAWSYKSELRSWLRDCRAACEAPKIQDFLSDFIQYIDLKLGPRAGTL